MYYKVCDQPWQHMADLFREFFFKNRIQLFDQKYRWEDLLYVKQYFKYFRINSHSVRLTSRSA